MARLQSIIRIRKWELDEKRRELVILEEARGECVWGGGERSRDSSMEMVRSK